MIKLILFFFISLTQAQETHYLNRSPKGLLMGDAYTAGIDDEYALFYNPASLGRNTGFSLTPFQADAGVTNVLAYENKFDNMPKKDPTGIADRVMGIPIYAHAGTTPGLKMAGFGFSMLANQTATMTVRDKTTPVLDLDYRYDRGYVVGYGLSFGSGKPKKKKSKKKKEPTVTNGSLFSIGYAFKQIYRDALVGSFPVFGSEMVNILTAEDNLKYQDIRDKLGYSKGEGKGHDFGMEYTLYRGNTETNWSFSVLDIGDTKFRLLDGAGPIPKQDMIISSGVSFKQDFWFFDYKFAADFHPINLPVSLIRKVHLGFEAGPKIVKVLAGYNGGYASYGAMVDLYFMRLIAGFYGIETGSQTKQVESKRAVVYLSLFDFSFDVL